MSTKSVENLFFLSAAARYNTERRPLLRGYFDDALRSGGIFRKDATDSVISKYWESERERINQPENAFRHLLHIYPDDPQPQHYQLYLGVRYADISEQIRGELGYSAVDLVSLEAFLYNQISNNAEQLNIASDSHTFEDKEEPVQTGKFKKPSEVFQDRWRACIEFSRSELLNDFLVETEDQELAQHLSLTERIDAVDSMVNFLSKSYGEENTYSPFQFLSTPLFQVEGTEDRILVPFPSLLVTTAQMRIEELFQRREDLGDLEDEQKGDLVEELTMEALSEFDSRNLIHSFNYTDPHPRETDGLLLFEDSFWSVEVKSHPIFRKLPSDVSTALSRFENKTKDAIRQGENAIRFLREDGNDVLYNLTGEKSPKEKEYGTIIVLDGLLPTLFSQNQRIDQIFDLSEIYEVVEENDRVLLITLFDLFELANQIDELDRLEEYLLWRTDYGFDMPIFAFNERDYWAMFFDNYASNESLQEVIDDAAETESLVAYISKRFNDKPHLPEDGFSDYS